MIKVGTSAINNIMRELSFILGPVTLNHVKLFTNYK